MAPSYYIYQVKPDYVPFDQQGVLQDGVQACYRHKFVGRPCMYKNTAPVRVKTSSKDCASLHGIPRDYHETQICPGASWNLGIKHPMLR